MEYLSALKKSVVAGLMIGIGCTVFLNMDNSIVASFLFGLGLFTIINLELNLFTGKIGYICKENCAETLITLVGNGIGVNIMAFLMKQTRVGVRLVEKAGPIVETKLSDTYISLFLLPVFYGIFRIAKHRHTIQNALALRTAAPKALPAYEDQLFTLRDFGIQHLHIIRNCTFTTMMYATFTGSTSHTALQLQLSDIHCLHPQFIAKRIFRIIQS